MSKIITEEIMQNEIEIMRVLRIPPMGKLVVAYKDGSLGFRGVNPIS